jgi:MFS family permease
VDENGTPGRLHTLLRAFQHRNYRLFFSGQLVSLTGTWMQSVAQAWLVYRLTGSAALLGLVAFASRIPVFLLAPLGGAVADKRSRRRILMATQSSSMLLAFTLAALTLGGWVHIWHIFVLAALLGIVNAFDIPARQAFVVEMVGREDLVNAIALNSSMINGARIVGPALAGVLVSAVGEGWCFFLNGASYVAVIAGLRLMRVPPRPKARPHASALSHIAAGFHFAWHAEPIRALLLLVGLGSLTGLPYMVLMPIFAAKILHGGPEGLGILMAAAGSGALTGALTLASRRGIRGLGRWVTFAAAGFGISLIAFSLSRSFYLSAALLLPTGFFMMLQMASSNTLIQAMVPDHLRGRVMALYSMMLMGMMPFGALLAGVLAEHLGAPVVVGAGGAASILGAGWCALRMPSLRGKARELIVAQDMTAGEPPDEMTGKGVP